MKSKKIFKLSLIAAIILSGINQNKVFAQKIITEEILKANMKLLENKSLFMLEGKTKEEVKETELENNKKEITETTNEIFVMKKEEKNEKRKMALNSGVAIKDTFVNRAAEDKVTGSLITKQKILSDANSSVEATGNNLVICNEENLSFQGNSAIKVTNGALAINKGEIANIGEKGIEAAGNDALAINENRIANKGIYGMLAYDHGASVINKGNIENKGNSGITAMNGGSGTNTSTGTISNKGNNGMEATGNGSSVINYGEISNTGDNGMLAYGEDTLAINNGEVANIGNNGMWAKGNNAIIKNFGTIANQGSSGMTIEENALGINEDGGIIKNNVTIISGGTFENNGNVIKENDIAVKAEGDNSIGINNSTGTINGKIEAVVGGQFINYGTITSSGEILKAWKNGTVINNGQITATGNNAVGISALEGDGQGSKAENSGEVKVEGHCGKGMIANGQGSIAINKEEAVITVTGEVVRGMQANSGGRVENNGTINIEQQGTEESIGIDVDGQGSIGVNNGVINMNGSNILGMRAINGGKIQNNGQIFLNGIENNDSMWADNNSQIINSGNIISDGDINFDDFGDGKFIMSSNGKVKGENISGTVYTSGALTLGSLEDEYNSYKSFEGNTTNLNLKSDSYMFDAKLSENGSDVLMKRKNFSEIINDNKFSQILEENYKGDDKDKIEYYDSLKLYSNRDDLNFAADLSTGRNFYPSIAKQSYEAINFINESIFKTVLDRNYGNGIRYLGGYDYKTIEEDGTKDLIGYEEDIRTVHFGIDKPFGNYWRIGGTFAIAETDTDFNNRVGRKEDRFIEGLGYGIYRKDDIEFLTALTIGVNNGDITRKYDGTEYDADLDGKYFGIINRGNRTFINTNNYYLRPEGELSVIGYWQDEINETGDKFNLEVSKMNYINILIGTGAAVGKIWELKDDVKIDFSLNGNIYYRWNTGDETVKTSLDIFDSSIESNPYMEDEFYEKFGLNLYVTNGNMGFYLSGMYKIDDNYDEFITTLGVNYKFYR